MNSEEWIKLLGPFDSWNERLAMAMWAVLGMPDGYFDVGSGTGAMVNLARRLGIEAYGVDQIDRSESYLFKHDLRYPFMIPYPFGRKFGLVSCIEVAEHLPPECDVAIMDTIKNHAKGWIVFSTAHPGQEGDDHIGIRPTPHWRKLLWDRGWTYDPIMTSRLSLAWLNIQSPAFWLPNNVQVFHP